MADRRPGLLSFPGPRCRRCHLGRAPTLMLRLVSPVSGVAAPVHHPHLVCTYHKQLQLTCTIPLDSGSAGSTYNRVHHLAYLLSTHTYLRISRPTHFVAGT
ncbi:hypothetical protein LX32DRAFT_105923 [Colletotrichum zoysiae]|uniref:Uncharacterized protein n=1 Tax=Colletotrichum zoysiae TaxID=1216348 RepID=A0AAD9M4T2_9PEZI|nr:hypothetical protein LX32DRAFT_105923 [Colletotrichum zoysiae]